MLPLSFTAARSKWRLARVLATFLLLSTSTYLHSRTSVIAADVAAASLDAVIRATPLPAEQDILVRLGPDNGDDDVSAGYAPDFGYFDRNLLGRQEPQAPDVADELVDNVTKEKEILPGISQFFVLKRGQSPGDRVWISANTCRQPIANGTEPPKNRPQLDMYVSTSPNNQKPGPTSIDDLVTPPSGILFDEGFASVDVDANSDIYIGIHAPNPEKDWTGSWSYEIAASASGPYHSYNAANPFLYMIDTDSDSALFITYNLNETNITDANKWRDNNPFSMFAFEVGDQSNVKGMERSLCALKSEFGNSTLNTTTTITTKFGGEKAQFYIQGLKKGTKYNGFLTVEGGKDVVRLPGGGRVRAGGMVFQSFEFDTKVEQSCQLLFDLKFCDAVAYAVPSSPVFTNDTNRLKALYDEQAENYYTNFTRSLAQVACDTTSEAQYSLARTCKDCERDYKNWLCSVLIPRCEGWSATDDFLQERNINEMLPDGSKTHNDNMTDAFREEKRDRFAYSGSRNPMIDKDIRPGPYKEMLPCEDLCFDIVRSCPAQLGFSCPNSPARELTYGNRDRGSDTLTCSFPGAVVKLNVQGAAGLLSPRVRYVIVTTTLAMALGGI